MKMKLQTFTKKAYVSLLLRIILPDLTDIFVTKRQKIDLRREITRNEQQSETQGESKTSEPQITNH
jgi:hypothetical protein